MLPINLGPQVYTMILRINIILLYYIMLLKHISTHLCKSQWGVSIIHKSQGPNGMTFH